MVHYFICEKCDLAFSLRLGLEHVCPGCRSEFIRKRRNRDLVEDGKYTGIVAGQPDGDREYTGVPSFAVVDAGTEPAPTFVDIKILNSWNGWPIPSSKIEPPAAPTTPAAPFDRHIGCSNRRKVLRVPYRHVLHSLLFGRDGLPEMVEVIRGHGLPEDVAVLSVRENYEHRTFDFLLVHPSFPEVADGDWSPVVPPLGLYYEVIPVRPPEQL